MQRHETTYICILSAVYHFTIIQYIDFVIYYISNIYYFHYARMLFRHDETDPIMLTHGHILQNAIL